jgi:hypothetical protein
MFVAVDDHVDAARVQNLPETVHPPGRELSRGHHGPMEVRQHAPHVRTGTSAVRPLQEAAVSHTATGMNATRMLWDTRDTLGA